MTNRTVTLLGLALLTFAISCSAPGQTRLPRYTAITSKSPFDSYKTPIGLAILVFNGDATLDIKLFNVLRQDTSVLKKFTIFPYDVLRTQMDALGLIKLDASDQHTLSQLRDQLNINLVVTGKAIDNGFDLAIVSTNGGKVFDHSYFNTSKSTAIADAALLFSGNIVTDYVDVGKIEWIEVDSGSCEMGSNDGYGDEKPVHTVQVKQYYMGATKVTFDQYDAFCDATGRNRLEDNGWGRGRMPVYNVSWDEANAYCKWLSDQLGEVICLPSEAEYEFAARGGTKSTGHIYSGSDYIDDVAWFVGNSKGQPHDVGGRMPNELGFYDLSGDAWEWCADWYHTSYNGAPSDGKPWNEEIPNTPYHAVRGGGWDCSSINCRVSVRNAGNSSGWVNFAGFRLVRESK